mmetsp:Transcript_85800/g.226349  ORF Transcript_85800/g.226349 Transcript_85800/m.226349 type:complete len:103 (+) Transcript_85800:224-532(+)
MIWPRPHFTSFAAEDDGEPSLGLPLPDFRTATLPSALLPLRLAARALELALALVDPAAPLLVTLPEDAAEPLRLPLPPEMAMPCGRFLVEAMVGTLLQTKHL